MSPIARPAFAALLVTAASALVSACGGGGATSSAASSAGATTSAGSGGAGGSAAAYRTSECGACVEQKACVSQLNACAADPSCAAYLDCLDACPVASGGDADRKCEKACPAVTGSAGTAAKEALTECRLSGPGATTCAGCGQIDTPKDPLFQQMCPASTETNTCYICEDEHCCDAYKTCLGDQACVDLQTCIKACPQADTAAFVACEDKCYAAHPDGFANFSRKITCITYFCPDTDTCGSVAEDACTKCTNLHCADAFAACEVNLPCKLLEDCKAPCSAADHACFDACDAKIPEGVALEKAFLDCALAHCELACSGAM